MTITIADKRRALWQWDTGRRLRVGSGVEQIHYQNRALGCSVDVDVGADGTAIIPDELLQDCHTLTAYVYVTDDTGAYTMVQQDFIVHKRAKPAGYVYTPTDQMTLQTIQRQIGDLADLTSAAKTNLVEAINEAARTGGGADGVTPHIGGNGNWYIGSTDTGKPSRGETGPQGAPGKDGSDATVTAASIKGALGYTPAAPGDIPVVPTAEIAANTAARHSHANKRVLDGITAAKTAAWDAKAGTAAATQSVAGLMSAADKAKLDGIERGANKTTVPTALKNPNALTIKIGGTTVTYDGSAAKTVTIADGSEVAY